MRAVSRWLLTRRKLMIVLRISTTDLCGFSVYCNTYSFGIEVVELPSTFCLHLLHLWKIPNNPMKYAAMRSGKLHKISDMYLSWYQNYVDVLSLRLKRDIVGLLTSFSFRSTSSSRPTIVQYSCAARHQWSTLLAHRTSRSLPTIRPIVLPSKCWLLGQLWLNPFTAI